MYICMHVCVYACACERVFACAYACRHVCLCDSLWSNKQAFDKSSDSIVLNGVGTIWSGSKRFGISVQPNVFGVLLFFFLNNRIYCPSDDDRLLVGIFSIVMTDNVSTNFGKPYNVLLWCFLQENSSRMELIRFSYSPSWSCLDQAWYRTNSRSFTLALPLNHKYHLSWKLIFCFPAYCFTFNLYGETYANILNG